MENLGFASALIGAFSADRKTAKARELHIANSLYSMEQEKMKQMYSLQADMAKNEMLTNKQASAITFSNERAQKVADIYNNGQKEMLRTIKEKYNGDRTRYFLTEGFDKMVEMQKAYDEKMAHYKRVDSDIAKYLKASQEGNAFKVDGDNLQKYMDGETDSFTYSGAMTPISDDYLKNVPMNQEVTFEDIFNGGENGANRVALQYNYMKEHGVADAKDIDMNKFKGWVLGKYSHEGKMGTGEAIETLGEGISYTFDYAEKKAKELNLNPSDQKSLDNFHYAIGDRLISAGFVRANNTRKDGGLSLSSNYVLHDALVSPVLSSLYGKQYNESSNSFTGPSTMMFDEAGVQISGDGIHKPTYTLEGVRLLSGFQVTRQDGSVELVVSSDDPAKQAELQKNMEGAIVKPVIVGEGWEPDTFSDDLYKFVVDHPLLGETINEALAQGGKVNIKEQAYREKSEVRKEAQASAMVNDAKDREKKNIALITGITESLDPNNGGNYDESVKLIQSINNDMSQTLVGSGIDKSMSNHITSLLFATAKDSDDFERRYDTVLKLLSNEHAPITKAAKKGPLELRKYLESKQGLFKLVSQAEIDKFENYLEGIIYTQQ